MVQTKYIYRLRNGRCNTDATGVRETTFREYHTIGKNCNYGMMVPSKDLLFKCVGLPSYPASIKTHRDGEEGSFALVLRSVVDFAAATHNPA